MPRALPVVDRRARPLGDLRISVTDRCNFRCRYCMPRELVGERIRFLPRAEILSLEEAARVARIAADLGVKKMRITGGEPLLRADLPKLVGWLAEIPDVDIAMTTNGSLLAERAEELARAGLRRVTVSLDALDDAIFRRMCDTDVKPARVLEGIEAAARAGLGPVKINTVVRRGVNDTDVVELARRFKGTGHIVRFIEYMDVGTSNGWRLDEVLPASDIVRLLDRELPLEAIPPNYPGEVARRYRYRDGTGEVGVIASVTRPFCGDCSRLRLSAEGKLYTCLFATQGLDLRPLLRGGADDEALRAALAELWAARDDRYSERRASAAEDLPRIEMSYIGG
jgi:cyclic pyranopterin phosphate synthase